MNRSGYPDGVSQAVHDRAMAETDGIDDHEERLDDYARQWAAKATWIRADADEMIDYAQEWSSLEDAAPVLKSILHAIIRHREPASCITAEDRMDAMIAEIQGALEPVARAAVEYADSLGEYGEDV